MPVSLTKKITSFSILRFVLFCFVVVVVIVFLARKGHYQGVSCDNELTELKSWVDVFFRRCTCHETFISVILRK